MDELKSLKQKIDDARHYEVKSSDPSVITSKKESTPLDSQLNNELLEVLEKQQQSIDELKRLVGEQKQ